MNTNPLGFDKPEKGYTDAQWQQDFKILRDSTLQSKESRMPVPSDYHDPYSEYHGQTQYQYYCRMINDILKNIRHGKTDYCFFTYQVAELLKYEHDRLVVHWLPGDQCFSISLKTK